MTAMKLQPGNPRSASGQTTQTRTRGGESPRRGVISLTDDQARIELAAHERRAAALVKCMDGLRLSRAVRRRPAYDAWIFELEEAVRSAFRNQPSGEDHYELVLANPDSLDAACWAFTGLMDAILEGWDVFVRSQFNRAQRRALAFGRRWRRPGSDEPGHLTAGDLDDDTGPPGHLASVSPISSNAPPACPVAPLSVDGLAMAA